MSSEVAAPRVHTVSQRFAPGCWIWGPRRGVRGDVGAGKEPDRNASRCPLRGVRTALDSVEAISVGLSIRRRLGAASIAIGISQDRARR